MLFDEGHGFGSGAAGITGIHHKDGPLIDGLRQFTVVLVGLVGNRIPVEADVSDFWRRTSTEIPPTMPSPARRIGTTAIFLPAIIGVSQVSMGVSTVAFSVRRSAAPQSRMSMAISLHKRAEFVRFRCSCRTPTWIFW